MDPFFCPFTPLKTKILKKWKKLLQISLFYKCAPKMMIINYDVWFLWYKVRWIECFVILYYFFPFYHPSNPENQNLEKKKTAPAHVIILHTCTKNNNHKMYASWDMACNRLRTIFCSFIPVTTWKNIFLKNWKKHLEIWSFYTCVP